MTHGAQLNLASALLHQIRRLGPKGAGREFTTDLLGPLSVAQLANAGLCPVSLPSAGQIRQSVPLSKTANNDETAFARATTTFAGRCRNTGVDTQIIATALAPQYKQLLDDPCMLGWIYQLLLREQSGELRRGKAEIAPERIAAATQWFTPDWVAQFLVEETIGHGRLQPSNGKFVTVLDPACGAGHILVPALRQLVAARPSENEADRSVINALNESLFGFDIDPLMIELSAFAIYLECRGLTGSLAELPMPNLFVVSSTTGGDDAIGSLWLGANESAELKVCSPISGDSNCAQNIPRGFDVIVANPPYLSHRMMPESISAFLKSYYPSSQYDLYAAFFSMGMKLLAPHGRMAMICQQSFLSIQRYGQLRSEMIEKCQLESVAQLGSGAFAAKAGEKVNNAIVVLSKKNGAERSGENIRFWRLLDVDDKILAATVGLNNLPALEVEASYVESLFHSVENAPIALWCPREINNLFRDCDPMQDGKNGIVCTNGLFTCDNQRFVKRFTEVAEHERDQYVAYDKGGGQKWYRTTPYLLHWKENGDEIRHFRKSRGQAYALPGEDFYFKNGVTYSYIGTRGFKARMLSPNSIFDIASSAVFSESLDDLYILGFLNSALVCFLLGVLNPTINFQIGDLRRLPFIEPSKALQKSVAQSSGMCIALARRIESLDPASPEYSKSILHGTDETEWQSQYCEYERIIANVNEQERSIQREIDNSIFDLYGITQATREIILNDPWVVRSRGDLCKPVNLQKCIAGAKAKTSNSPS